MRNEEEGFYRAFAQEETREGETKRIDAILAPPEYNFKQAQPAKYNVLPDFQYLHLEHCPTIR